MDKEIKRIVRTLEDQKVNPGWRVEQGGKHLKAYPADRNQRPVTIPLTPSDWRAIPNLRSQLRRAGAQGI